MDTAKKMSDRKRFWMWAVSFVFGMALIGASWAYVSEKAFGATTTTPTTQVQVQDDEPDSTFAT